MSFPVKILIVEDEMIIAAKISLQLSNLGYEVSAIVPRGEDAVVQCQQNRPDILLLDINLKGKMNGIETAQAIRNQADIAIVYLTANTDQETFELARQTKPYAFITKPYQKHDLQRAIELIVSRLNDSTSIDHAVAHKSDPLSSLDDRIFVRHKETMVKLFLSDICFIEADRSYCRIFTEKGEFLLSVPLKRLEDKLKSARFYRLHRSYIVNLERIDEVAENYVVVSNKSIPIGKSYKASFLKRIQLI